MRPTRCLPSLLSQAIAITVLATWPSFAHADTEDLERAANQVRARLEQLEDSIHQAEERDAPERAARLREMRQEVKRRLEIMHRELQEAAASRREHREREIDERDRDAHAERLSRQADQARAHLEEIERASHEARESGNDDRLHELRRLRERVQEALERSLTELRELQGDHDEGREVRQRDRLIENLSRRADELRGELEGIETAKHEARRRDNEGRLHELNRHRAEIQEALERTMLELRELRGVHEEDDEHQEHEVDEHFEHLERVARELEIRRQEVEIQHLELELVTQKQKLAIHLAELASNKQAMFSTALIAVLESSEHPEHATELLTGLTQQTDDPACNRLLHFHLARLHQSAGHPDRVLESLRAILHSDERRDAPRRDRPRRDNPPRDEADRRPRLRDQPAAVADEDR